MKNLIHILLITAILSGTFGSIDLFSQNTEDPPVWKKMHYLSKEEMQKENTNRRDFYPTDPPPTPIHNIAEFDNMEGVIVRYPFGLPLALIAEMSEDAIVTTVVGNQSQENNVVNQYNGAGVNLANCNFLHAPSNSYWTRDYGPWFVLDGNYEIGIVNFPYNRPRSDEEDLLYPHVI